MGSLFEIVAFGGSPELLDAKLHRALDLVATLELQLSHYLAESELSLLNANAFRVEVPVSQNLFDLLLQLREWSEETGGAYDPTIGGLIRAWGFYRQNQPHDSQLVPPSEEFLRSAIENSGWKHIDLNRSERSVRFRTAQVEINLGATGKGYAVDCVARSLLSDGVESALIHSGFSSIYAIGSPPDAEGWQVALPSDSEGEEDLETVFLRDEALSTSDSREQTTTIDGKTFSHILDPKTGFPIECRRALSLLSSAACMGDVFSTALLADPSLESSIFSRVGRNIRVAYRNGT